MEGRSRRPESVSIEWHEVSMEASNRRHPLRIGLARVHPEGGAGSRWTFACVIKDEGNGVAYLELAATAPELEDARAVREELKRQGFRAAEWERRNVNNPRVTGIKAKD